MIKVLIADDESIILNGIRRCVAWAELGMEVVATAQNGKAALHAIEKHRPDLCLLDIRMPKADGLEVAQKYLALRPDGIVILITGYDEFSYAQKAVNTGVFAYILKPVNEEELIQTVERAGSKIRMEQQRSMRLTPSERMFSGNDEAACEDFLRGCLSGSVQPGRMPEEELWNELRLHPPVWVQAFRLGSGGGLRGSARDAGMRKELDDLLAEADNDGGRCYAVEMPDNIGCLLRSRGEGALGGSVTFRLIENLLWVEAAVAMAQDEAPTLAGIAGVYARLEARLRNAEPLSPIIRALLRDVRAQYGNPDIRLQSVAERYNITASYLSRLFSQSIGIPFTQFLRDHRIRQSLRYLRNQDVPIQEIAEKIGFSSQHYFAETFKQTAGVTPSAWRKQYAKQKYC